jgi:hypothetical protein
VLADTQLLLLRKRVHASPVSVLDWNANSAVTSPKLVRYLGGCRFFAAWLAPFPC